MGGCGKVRALPERGTRMQFTYHFLHDHYEERQKLVSASERQLEKIRRLFDESKDVDGLSASLRQLADEIRLQSFALAFNELRKEIL